MLKSIYKFISLQQGEEPKDQVLANVISNISFRGANLWILACAIVVASVGLNVNSTAVIIGAMLISPLMGPIVGAGFALGTYNFDLLKKSAKNLLIATLVSLTVSYLYFLLSPFKEAQSELLARTSPNIYDVLIAFFGGLVGVIAITRVEKGNPIPGVAIATALMPPLCTAGYGLAVGNVSYFLGALYLYTINCFFICISTFLIVKYLRYPKTKFVNPAREARITRTISVLIVVMLAPSFYLAYALLQERNFVQNVDTFVNDEFTKKGYTLIYEKTQFNSSPKKIELAFLDKKFTKAELVDLEAQLKNYKLANTQLIIKQDSSAWDSERLAAVNKNDLKVDEKDITIQNLRKELATYTVDNQALLNEIDLLFPEIKPYSLGLQRVFVNPDSSRLEYYLIYSNSLQPERKETLGKWLQAKLQVPQVSLVKN